MADHWKETAKGILSHHFLLGELEPSVLDQLLDYGHYRVFPRGEVIFQKGDPGDSLRWSHIVGQFGSEVKVYSAC